MVKCAHMKSCFPCWLLVCGSYFCDMSKCKYSQEYPVEFWHEYVDHFGIAGINSNSNQEYKTAYYPVINDGVV